MKYFLFLFAVIIFTGGCVSVKYDSGEGIYKTDGYGVFFSLYPSFFFSVGKFEYIFENNSEE